MIGLDVSHASLQVNGVGPIRSRHAVVVMVFSQPPAAAVLRLTGSVAECSILQSFLRPNGQRVLLAVALDVWMLCN